MLIVTQAHGGQLSARGRIPTVRVDPLPAAIGLDLLASRFPDLSLEVRELLFAASEGMPRARRVRQCPGR